MIVFRTPKGWTGPKFVDGKPVEGTWRAHQVPIADFENPEHLKQLEDWMQSYRPQELFDERGKFREELAALAPTGHRRMGSNPHANGGELLQPLSMPHFHDYAVPVPKPGSVQAEATRVLGKFLRDVMKLNLDSGISACSAPTRPRRTGWRRSTRSPARNGWPRSKPSTSISAPMAASWRC